MESNLSFTASVAWCTMFPMSRKLMCGIVTRGPTRALLFVISLFRLALLKSFSFLVHWKIQLQRIIWELTLKIIFDFLNKWYCRVYRTLSKLSYFWWDSSAKLYSQHKLRTWWDGIDVDRKWEARRAKGNLLDGTGGPMIVGGVGQGGILQERRDRGLMALPK